MPYGKRRHSGYGARKGFRKKRRHSTKAQVARIVQDILKVEKKHWDIGLIEANCGTGWANIDDAVGIFGVVQGTDENQRIGSMIKLTDIYWRWNLTSNYAPTSRLSETVRLVMLLDKSCNGLATPHTGQHKVFNDNDYQSYNNLDNKKRYRTLYDSGPITVVKSAGGYDGVNIQYADGAVNGSVYLKNLNLEIDFSANGAVLADLNSNNITFCVSAHLGSQVVLDSLVRFKYTDV